MASYNRIVDDIQDELPDLRVVDSISALCDLTACSQKPRSGEILYRDALHLSPAGGRRFAMTSGLTDMLLEAWRLDAA
jgi:SGNH domain (fused to AT3 domains)